MARKELQFPWVLASLGAGLVVVGAAALLRFPAAPNPKHTADDAVRAVPMQISRLGNGEDNKRLQEELALQDPTPLFGPTRWNSGQASQPVMPEPGTAFVSFRPALFFPENDPAIALPPPVRVPATPLAALGELEKEPRLVDLARLELNLAPLARRLVQLEVSRAESGEVQFRQNIPEGEGGAAERLSVLRQEFWTPIQLMIAVNPGGLVGRPMMVASSGSERIDNWALEFLSARAHLGARLQPGFYRVLIGP